MPLIAVVDDDASVRKALTRLIKSAGLEAVGFGSAQEFIDSGVQTQVGCLILDIHLGGMSGFELEQRLRITGPSLPVIFITAHDDVTTQARARQTGAVAYIRKPFDGQALLESVRQAISQGPP